MQGSLPKNMHPLLCTQLGGSYGLLLRSLKRNRDKDFLEHLQEQLSPYLINISKLKYVKVFNKYWLKIIFLHQFSKYKAEQKQNNGDWFIVCRYNYLSYIQLSQTINMFNTFTAQKLAKQSIQKQETRRRMYSWNKRYKTQIQPQLVNKFNRRVNGFAKKMQDQPVVIKNNKVGILVSPFQRRNERNLNISKDLFIFKNSNDWKSIHTPIQRIERQNIMKSYCQGTDQRFIFRNIGSQSKYEKLKIDYRSRQKQKQINPPMKYTNKNSQFILTTLPKLKNKSRNSQRQNLTQIAMKKYSMLNQSQNSKDYPQNLSYADIDGASMHQSFMVKKNPEKTQLQLMEEQQMKALAQKKLYFKSLIQLEQNVKTAKQRNTLRQVLTKCGIFKPISGKVYEQEQIDRFMELMKTKY